MSTEWTKELGDAFWRGVRHQAERSGKEEPTLRDLFAMAALAGVAQFGADEEIIAARAYAYADAMMAARKGGSDE